MRRIINFDISRSDVKSWKWWSSWLKIALGCIIVSLGFELFMFPYKITPGGVWGMSVVLHELFPSIEQGWFGYMMDIPLLVSGFVIFGPVFGLKTVFAALFTPAVMLVMPHLIYPDAAVQTAETLLWGHMNLSDDLMLASIFGAVFIGTGVGIVIREQATTAGTDIVAMILKRFAHMKFSNGLMLADSFVVLCSIVVLVFMAGETPTLPLYSLITIFLSAKVIDFVVEGRSEDKLLFIISREHKQEIADFIIGDLARGGTYIKSSGMYSGQDRDMIFVVVSMRELVPVKRRIKEIDPCSFVVVTSASETLGEGFKSFNEVEN